MTTNSAGLMMCVPSRRILRCGPFWPPPARKARTSRKSPIVRVVGERLAGGQVDGRRARTRSRSCPASPTPSGRCARGTGTARRSGSRRAAASGWKPASPCEREQAALAPSRCRAPELLDDADAVVGDVAHDPREVDEHDAAAPGCRRRSKAATTRGCRKEDRGTYRPTFLSVLRSTRPRDSRARKGASRARADQRQRRPSSARPSNREVWGGGARPSADGVVAVAAGEAQRAAMRAVASGRRGRRGRRARRQRGEG